MEDIIKPLEKIEETGSFCSKRTEPVEKLSLEIKEFGALKLPITASHAKQLIKFAKPAKFGFRDKTLLDKAVRDTWEITRSKIKISKAWNDELKLILDSFKADLGLPEGASLTAILHNLIIYEVSQFFSPHQDSEKVDGMVASLVVVLPSAHSGGSLVIDHQGEKKQFHTSRYPLDKLSLIAFYADCHHEVKPIKQGYRVALTYNLLLKNNLDASITKGPKRSESFQAVANSLRAYFSPQNVTKEERLRHDNKVPRQFVYLLDHSYTQKGLSWSHLKNVDTVRAEALKMVAEALDLDIHLALAEVQETWDCESDGDDYYYRRKKKRYYDEYEFGSKTNEANVELVDLIQRNVTLSHWIDRAGVAVDLKSIGVAGAHLCWTKASDQFEPFQSEYEGFMGNYGNTMDRWYHRAAIILWQKKDHYSVLFQIDAGSVIEELSNLSKEEKGATRVAEIIHSLLPYWGRVRHLGGIKPVSSVFRLAFYVNDPKLAEAMLKFYDISVLTPGMVRLFLSLKGSYGTPWCLSMLSTWTTSKDTWGYLEKCKDLSGVVRKISSTQDNVELTDWLLNFQLHKLKHEDSADREVSPAFLKESFSQRMEDVTDFVEACWIAEASKQYASLLEHVMCNPKLYPPFDLANIIFFLQERLNQSQLTAWSYNELFHYVFDCLNNEKALGLRDKDDWSIQEASSCSCSDCRVLYDFLKSSTVKEMRWPMGKDRRAHIHQIIDGLSIPVTHETEHAGSPHKLVLIKKDKLYHQAKKRYIEVEKLLSRLAQDCCDVVKELY
ncbi:MAG: 2OG-Fe(II) oxygenase [Gammaproteobacteria bacterium]